MTLAFEDFLKVDVRVGTVRSARLNDKARKPAYALEVDLGAELGVRTSSAQITTHYRPEDLVGRQVLAVVNFAPRRIAGVKSEVLVLGVPDADGEVVLIAPTRPVPDGGRLF
jgi:tRNA-binding protein